MTHVPWLPEMPRLPAMCGTETLAMVVSSTTMKLVSASTAPARMRRNPVSGAAASALAFISNRPYLAETSISASMERPTRSGCACNSFGSSATRTGRRWTTLIQLPVAFCAGISANDEPVPPESPTTLP